jgi:hypothetical protein
MAHIRENPPAGGAGGLWNAFPDGECSSNIAQKPEVTQAKIDLLSDEIGWIIGPMIATLEAALAMREAENIPGLIYGLRCAGAYWRSISVNAKDLVGLQNGKAGQ